MIILHIVDVSCVMWTHVGIASDTISMHVHKVCFDVIKILYHITLPLGVI